MTKRPLKKIIYRLTSVLHNNKNIDRTTCILMWNTSDLVNWHSTKTTVDWVELASCPAVRPYSGLAYTLPSYWLLCHTTERKIQSLFATPAAAGHHRWSSNVCTRHHPHMEEHANANNMLDGISSRWRTARDTVVKDHAMISATVAVHWKKISSEK